MENKSNEKATEILSWKRKGFWC